MISKFMFSGELVSSSSLGVVNAPWRARRASCSAKFFGGGVSARCDACFGLSRLIAWETCFSPVLLLSN